MTILLLFLLGVKQLSAQAGCVVGTGNRIAGTWHSDLYIAGNTSTGSNDLYGWGQDMSTLVGLTASSGADVHTPSIINNSNYSGIALEVRGSSPTTSTNVFGLRTSTNLYLFGDGFSTITNWTGFGGASLSTASSNINSKLPIGVSISDIAEFRVSSAAIALLTNSGNVYMLSKNKNLRGDSTVAEIVSSNGWHSVKLSDGTTPLSNVSKLSVSGNGVLALTSNGKLYYWGDGNPFGHPTAPKSYSYAFDISTAVPSGTNISDVLVTGQSHSNLFLLCTDGFVYSCGYNDNGILGINNATTTTYTSSFSKVKKESDLTGASTLNNITKIDGNNNGDRDLVVAMNASGQIFGWGDNNLYGMLGSSGSSGNTDHFGAFQIFTSTTATYTKNPSGSATSTAAPGSGYTDVSVGGHFIIAFYTSGGTSQYWYLGHNTNGSIGYDPAAVVQSGTSFDPGASIYAPTYLNAPAGISFACSNTQPTINTTGSFSSFNACLNVASTTQTITISGINLSDNISVTTPSGFEVSTSSGSGFGTTATLTKSGGNVTATTLYVRISSAATGSVSGTITLTSTGATSKTFSLSGTVNTLPVVSSVTGTSRTGTGSLTISANTASSNSTIDWYQNSTGGTALATGTNSTTSFTTPSISTSTNYFAQARNLTTGCISATRSVTTATIDGSFSPGSIGTDQSICYNQAASSLTSVSDASGGTGSISYQWQLSTTSSTSGFANISGATLSTITLSGSLTQTTYYRRAASTTADGTIYTDPITITVNALPTSSAPVDNARTGSGPVIISATASAGATLDWYANATNGSVLSGGNGVTTYTTPLISETTTYFAEARNTTTGCIASSRISVLATITGSFSPGSITADQTICSGSTAAALTSVTNASGGTGSITYQWQLSTTSSSTGFTNISGETSTSTTPTGAYTQTTFLRRAATTSIEGTKYSNIITITVNELPNTLTAVNGSRTGSGIVNISVTAGASETANWYDASTGGSILSGGNGTLNYTTPSISATTTYYAEARNTTTGCISLSRTAVLATINTSTSSPTLSLSYTSPNVYTVGVAIVTLTPTSTGGAIASYSVSPSLPAGITINTTTGVITGTPSAVSTQTSYVVTGTNASGTITTTVVITVENPPPPPAGLTYTSPNVYTVGAAIGTLTPTSTGGAIASYSVSPSLPAGLTINTTTGVITGTPSAVSTQTSYVVTGTNTSGTATATVVMTVNIAPPTGLTYTSPNVYTVGTAIGSLTPTISGGAIASYIVSPSLPAGLTIDATTGIITGTPSAVSSQTSYVVTGANASGTVTATVVMTVNSGVIPQPQGALNAVDYNLLAIDTVILKLTVSSGTAPFSLILNNSNNSLKDTIRNLSPVNNDISFKLKQLDTTKIYTIFKLIDASNSFRTSGFTKDTTKINVLKPKIVLTLKADPTVKQTDNSFKTKLLLKIKNAGDLDLRNVQVNANLSTVFPKEINYILDSVRVLSGNLSINPNYNGAGSATALSSIQNPIAVSSSENKNTYSVLDQNFLFYNGVNLNKNEEGEVVYYVSIGATTQNVTLKLQFETAGAGVLTKSDGSSSTQEAKSKSDDGTNINQHPNITNDGLPLPTYVPLIPNEKIGASLSVSASKPVAGGYEFHFIAKIKNFGNINLDSLRIEYELNKMFKSPDQAMLVSNPIVKRGNIIYNATNYNGNTNINLFNYGGNLQVGDSAMYEYDLKVITNRISYTWPNYFVVFARSINNGIVIHDTSMAGLNPDPNNDNDPIEKFYTNATINYIVPAPPVVNNKTYVYGSIIPQTIGGLVKSTPNGTVPVWCNERTASCNLVPPSTPTEIGKYIFALRSYDTTSLLYSDSYVYDTIIIKPPVPLVRDSSFILGATKNPSTINGLATGLSGSILNYYVNNVKQSSIPKLPSSVGIYQYAASQTVNFIESDIASFKINILDPNNLLHLQKIVDTAVLQSNSTYNYTFKLIASNLSQFVLNNVNIIDNISNSISLPTNYSIISIKSTGGLIANNSFNGNTDINLTSVTSKLAINAQDTIIFVMNLIPKGFAGNLTNIADINVSSIWGDFGMRSSSLTKAQESSKLPTTYTVPELPLLIPEGFSPNYDGINDRFLIIKPFGTILDLEIFNRWGNIVYANSNYNNEWDGKGVMNFMGQDLVDGGYYYSIKAKDIIGVTKIFKGFVIIQR
jgi:gliding motility-associated-like protein